MPMPRYTSSASTARTWACCAGKIDGRAFRQTRNHLATEVSEGDIDELAKGQFKKTLGTEVNLEEFAEYPILFARPTKQI